MPEDPIEIIDNTAAGRFEAHLGEETAFAEYRLEADSIVFPHTVVPDAFSGRGVAGALARHGLSYARERGLRVKPTCSFFAGYIQKHPEYQDLVHPDFRKPPGLDA